MKYNLTLIANKAGVAISMLNVEYNTRQAALDAVDSIRDEMYDNTPFTLTYFLTAKGEENA